VKGYYGFSTYAPNAQAIMDNAELNMLRAENDRLLALLGHLYWWVHDLPVKHPQQGEWREQARALLNIHKGGE
jgi:hypothetical protein